MTANHRSAQPLLQSALLLLWLLIGCLAVYIASSSLQDIPFLQTLLAPLQAHVASDKAMYSPLAYYCLFTLVIVLERAIPVREQPILNSSVAQDILWYVGTVLFRVTFLAAYSTFLFSLYHRYLSGLTIDAAASWDPLTRFVVALLVTDFFRWLSHLIVHKVPVFWAFHAVHHSQTELNIFTDARVHPVERMVAGTIKFIPMLMLDNALPLILGWAIFETVYPKFYHANVRLHFGPLRYLFVTPQSHRVHHGVEPRYHDKNFGFTFSIWDRLFGTQYHDHLEYPETGIPDSSYPHETASDPLSLIRTFALQLLYPFQRIGRAFR